MERIDEKCIEDKEEKLIELRKRMNGNFGLKYDYVEYFINLYYITLNLYDITLGFYSISSCYVETPTQLFTFFSSLQVKNF